MNTLSLCFFLVWFLFSSKESYGGRINGGITKHHFYLVNVSSLLPSPVCTSSSKGSNKRTSLQVLHSNGPCSQLNIKKSTHAQILLQDQDRVDWIHTKISSRKTQNTMESTTLPAKDGNLIASANYFVTIGLGDPKRDLSLIFDTGSSLTWTQCKPCRVTCYPQIEPIFDPAASSSYTNVSCSSPDCNTLVSATLNPHGCSSSTCVYVVGYGDKSSSVGFLAKEKLTLTSTDTFDSFLFGCGQDNEGLFHGAAGLLGLGRDKISFPSQTAAKYNKHFSYCLPSTPSSTGYLTFGDEESVSKTAKFTPVKTISDRESLYALDIVGISVGGQNLPISATVFARGGSIIDSGAVITRLPPTAYSALRSAFRSLMKYPRAAAPSSTLDTCFDLSMHQTVVVPKIAFFFGGGVEVDLDRSGILYVIKPSQVCLGFAANRADSNLSIFGNTQQRTMEVVYDGAGSRVGFASGGCS